MQKKKKSKKKRTKKNGSRIKRRYKREKGLWASQFERNF